ncbi:DUF4235 domain-containing protein [Actinophytocola gossypii]|uniref:DUF4235 domain-containing protein n=1 Tax=Actinophytocola gossypii TaxID=2812003 RepID=A0ABT2J5B2_9PSEU|nr:DUF4235 domain-containing protein [Actinophytocola gossypii]MCT2582866.1 DUF4235 domain-containing protein [Actinophytocola gossypii]
MSKHKLIYKPLGLLFGVLGGVAASAVFGKVWEAITGDREAPEPTDKNRTWSQILLAAVIQGAIFGGVRAAIDRSGAIGYRKVTGTWPDDDSGKKKTKKK